MGDQSLRIGFMGTPEFALSALQAIVKAGHQVVCVYSQPPRPKGRGHKLQPSPVHAYAETQNIPVFHPKSLKSKDVQNEFAAHNLDVAIVAAYGLILPKPVLDAPKYGCINIHASLLPRWRGASPIHRAIWAGDQQSGVTLMHMDEGLDTGPEIMKQSMDIAPRETTQSLHDKLADMGANMVCEFLKKLAINGQFTEKEQESDGITYAHMLKKEDGKIDWDQPAEAIDRQIRALNPWPSTYTGTYADITTQDKDVQLKIRAATPSGQISDQRPGTILDKNGNIACGRGTVLTLEKIQLAGKQAMDFQSALNGGYIDINQVLK